MALNIFILLINITVIIILFPCGDCNYNPTHTSKSGDQAQALV